MYIGQVFDLVFCYDFLCNLLIFLGDYFDFEFIFCCFVELGIVMLCKCCFFFEMMVWCIVGMVFECKEFFYQIVNCLDIMLLGNCFFVVFSVVIQVCQCLGSEVVCCVFMKIVQFWYNVMLYLYWCGLILLVIDGVFWCILDILENDVVFFCQIYVGNLVFYLQVKMVCQMELISYLLMAVVFGMMKNSENEFVE